MEHMNDLKDLLKHEVLDLYSAEEQILDALPLMIEKSNNAGLRKALEEHLTVTEQQKSRLDQVIQLLKISSESSSEEEVTENEDGETRNKGFFSRIFGGGHSHKCLGMEGLIRESEKVLGEDMSPKVLDAAVVACAQKIEHYEICGYGTARAYARELNLGEVAELLEETLNEEYQADDRLTDLAVGGLNQKAEGKRGGTRSAGHTAMGNGTVKHAKANSNGTAKKKPASTSRSKSKSASSSRTASVSGLKKTSGGRKTAKKTPASGGRAKGGKKPAGSSTRNKSRGR